MSSIGGLSANSKDLYASAQPGQSAVGSRMIIGQAVLPRKTAGGVSTGEYCILFDDVAATAAANTFSAVSCSSAGAISIKTRNGLTIISDTGINTSGSFIFNGTLTSASPIVLQAGARSYTFGNGGSEIISTPSLMTLQAGAQQYDFGSLSPSFFGAGTQWLGGAAGPFGGSGGAIVYANAVNCSTFVTDFYQWTRVGNVVQGHFTVTLTITGVGVASFSMTPPVNASMVPGNFGAIIDVSGQAGTSTDSSGWSIRALVPTSGYSVATAFAYGAGGVISLAGSFAFLATA
jgi:hypothetical protein